MTTKKYSEFTERQKRGIVASIAKAFSYWSFDWPNLANTIRPRFLEFDPVISLQNGYIVSIKDSELAKIFQQEIGASQSMEKK
jgi:hypothetical protein